MISLTDIAAFMSTWVLALPQCQLRRSPEWSVGSMGKLVDGGDPVGHGGTGPAPCDTLVSTPLLSDLKHKTRWQAVL
jgi:hypothetical protein